MIRCKNIAWLGLFATAFFTACEKPEPLYPQPKTSLGVQSQIFAMGENYANQLWFDFATQKTESNAKVSISFFKLVNQIRVNDEFEMISL